ncbi:T9SS outer membrane translocon Sov/SprA [Acidiluteibacter ferrifornacis]|uniref:Cell surface protein SprA n=1 Tax=Acidiluteibacter ferrifornacis TaxID=2692424 RepID=A0A6N9NG74_9FLAO|nr:cell surface protein SprA [Acidiluteibacter ferrifornacis]NBG64794.1 cell surface protein SprA [Acidiluteibacter ferrifornacis]
MKISVKYTFRSIVALALFGVIYDSTGASDSSIETYPYEEELLEEKVFLKDNTKFTISIPIDSTEDDTLDLIYPFNDNSSDPFTTDKSPLYLKTPSNIKSGFEYDPETGQYNYYERLGEKYYRSPTYMSLEDYANYDATKRMKEYWKSKSDAETIERSEGFRPQLQVKGELFDRIFGGNTIDIRPQGSAELSFGVNVSKRDNPIIPERQRRTSSFDFNQRIQLNVIGNIGEKLKLSTSYNTEATFDFENQTKLEYTGYEDEIIQKIEAGNVSLPLQSSLINGSQTLFGVKTELQFGRLRVTSIFSQEKGERKSIEVKGGAQIQEFEKSAAEYEFNKHFFLSHFFRESYEQALQEPPRVNSRIQITDIEIYVTNNQGAFTNTKNIIAFTDLAEQNRIFNRNLAQPTGSIQVPSNGTNSLYQSVNADLPGAQQIRDFNNADQPLAAAGFRTGDDYERLQNAVLLNPSEYTINRQLGYISLNRQLNPQDILAVSYRYTYNGQVYQVGDLSTDGIDGQDALYLKLLKGSIINTTMPMWDLMMKNVYSLDAFNINPTDFRFEIWYLNSETGVEIPFIPAAPIDNTPLLNVLELDRMTINNAKTESGDGVFDFIPGVTINEKNGRVYFPVLEPFGQTLRQKLGTQELGDKYAFDSLYTTTQVLAEQDAAHNRFTIKGSYQSSSSSEISLNTFNIPQGSVVVTAGGAPLVENQDYQVDYNLGRITILNQGILESGTPIKISLGSNSLFNVQTKTLIGSRFDYRVSKDFSLGGTVLNLTERPITRKINIGDEPISNTVIGLDGTYRTEVPFLTTLADKLPFYDTKEKSTLTVQGEFARLFPGNSRAISKAGVAYIDDFEGSQSIIEIRNANAWRLASTPQGQEDLFPEGNFNGDLAYGFNRAQLAWYSIDPLFFSETDSRTPGYLKNSDSQANNYSRGVLQTEVFPNKAVDPAQNQLIQTLDLAYYPTERGPYNYDVSGRPGVSSGLNPNGTLKDPTTRWGGIMRDLQTSDFEASNVGFIQFWVMDPFAEQDGNPNQKGGELYFNIGSISEDILKDGRLMFENGLPSEGGNQNTSSVIWGRIPTVSYIINAFDNNPNARDNQDVGLDGLKNDAERSNFTDYMTQLQNTLDANAFNDFSADPSNDDFHYYRGADYDQQQLSILERYKRFNGTEGNSPAQSTSADFSTSSTTLPDNEDLNGNFSLDRTEAYYQYKVNLSPEALRTENVGSNYITDVLTATAKAPNGETKEVRWIQFKIPIREPDKTVGSIRDFKSIRFMRMFLKGFDDNIVVRFAQLGLVRGEWRKYSNDQLIPGDTHNDEEGSTTFSSSAVNVEENSNRFPINYTIPPGIQREVDFGTTNLRQINEQSLVLNVCNLNDGYTRSVYRNVDLDIRQYKKIKMYAHAEAAGQEGDLRDNEIAVVMRLAIDFEQNYYEYEVPLTVTPFGTTSSSPDLIWPEANNIDLEFDKLLAVKKNRNVRMLDPSSGISITNAYSEPDGEKNTIRVKGNPNLAEVRVVMIGVKNLRTGETVFQDDGLPKCAEVWVNELRLSDFDNEGGWAATARATAQIADLGAVTLSGSMSTPGWGSLEQKLNERQRETRMQYDLSTSVELGKLLPEQARLSIPMYFGVSENIIRPEYNPLDPDVPLNDLIQDDDLSQDYRDSIRRITDDYTKTKSINFTNVRKERSPTKEKMLPFDVENFAVSYAYTETFHRDINTEYDNRKTYRGGINYNYTAKPLAIEPFKNVNFFKERKAFTLIKDINFNLYPTQYSFQTQVNRTYNERQVRNNTSYFEFAPFYQKTFTWNRIYSLRYNITKSLIFNYNANNMAQIGEPEGRVDRDVKDEYKQFTNEVWDNVLKFGSNTQFAQNVNLTYTLPFSKIPYFEWISANATYTGSYNWTLNGDIDADSLGATIKNSGNYALNTNFNMTSLYNKVEYLRELSKPKKKKDEIKRLTLADKTYRKKVEAGEIEDTTKEDEPSFFRTHIIDNFSRLAMSLKTMSGSYSVNEGTVLPNYNRDMNVLGFDGNFQAPGAGFVVGLQEPGTQFFDRALNEGWLLEGNEYGTLFISGNYAKTYSKNLNFRASFQPVKDLRIELTANQTYSESTSRYYIWNDTLVNSNTSALGGYDFGPTQVNGSFSTSFISIRTAFVKDDDDTYKNKVFDEFLASRSIISQRLGNDNPYSTFTYTDTMGGVYADGYGSTSQEVLINSFLSAYSGSDASSFELGEITSRIPVPNWSITYDGLSKLEFFKRYFRSFTIGHRYRSTFNVGSFTTNPFFDEENLDTRLNNSGDFIPRKQIASVSISEQFSPLMNIDMTWNNSLLTRLEYKKDRNMSMSLNNNQITEVKGTEVVIGLGYRLKNVKFPFSAKDNKKVSDVDLRADFSVRNNRTVIRKIVENENQLTAGQRIFSIKFTADYVFSSRLNIRAFFDRIMNTPFISSSFPTANTNAGISLRFTLSQ